MNQRMYIAIAINDRYTPYAYVMLTSLFAHHAKGSLAVYILQSDLTEESKRLLCALGENYGQEIVFVTVSLEHALAGLGEAARKTADALPTTESWSKEMYYRLLLGELLPKEVVRALYLDVDDAMVQGNFSQEQQELFENLGDVRYFNSGVLLYNLEIIRKQYKFASYIDVARQYNYRLTNPDQDILNYVHAGKVKYIDNARYNIFSQTAELSYGGYDYIAAQGIVIHFAGRKPWNYNGVHYGVEKIWWDYARQTPFYQDMLEQVFYDGLRDDSYQTIMNLLQENSELKKNLGEAMAICQKLLGTKCFPFV